MDKNLREQIQDEIKRLHTDLGTTFIYVTHDQEEALNMSDRICLMSVGQIAQLGTPDDLYFNPNSRFVAEFIGESNLIEGRITGPGRMQSAAGQTFALPQGADAQGAEVALMVRPERLRLLAPDAPVPDGLTVIDGTVSSISFVGGMTRIRVVDAQGVTFMVKNVSEHANHRIAVGTPVRLGWSVADTVVLRV